MKNQKFTKGEWKIKESFKEYNSSSLNVYTSERGKVCEVKKHFGNSTETIANAQLIASAPELLDHLNKMIEVFEVYAKDAQFVSGVFMAKQAIIKATK